MSEINELKSLTCILGRKSVLKNRLLCFRVLKNEKWLKSLVYIYPSQTPTVDRRKRTAVVELHCGPRNIERGRDDMALPTADRENSTAVAKFHRGPRSSFQRHATSPNLQRLFSKSKFTLWPIQNSPEPSGFQTNHARKSKSIIQTCSCDRIIKITSTIMN